MKRSRSLTALRSALTAAAALMLISACGGTGGGGGSGSGSGGKELLVWVDDTRTPAAQQYKAAHPDEDIRIVTIPHDAGYVPTKVSLANQAKSGWPDVVFLTNPAEAATLAAKDFGYAAPLDGLVPASTIQGFAKGSLDTCTFDGKVYCLRNDIAPTVLWYDAKLMQQYGYAVPKTWADYQAIGVKAAKEHPGTIVGSVNGKYGAGVFFGSSGCPTRDTQSLTQVHIDLAQGTCTRVAQMLQPLVDSKAVIRTDPTDPAFAKLASQNKVLMLPGPAWFGDYLFGPSLKVPKGRIAAAPMPLWPGETTSYSGQVGGGAFLVSSHATGGKAKEAADLITWMATDSTLQSKQPTYPASTTAAQAWATAKGSADYYAQNPIPVETAAAASMRPGFGAIRFEADWQTTFNDTLGAAVDGDKSLAAALPAWQSKLDAAAKTAGYSLG